MCLWEREQRGEDELRSFAFPTLLPDAKMDLYCFRTSLLMLSLFYQRLFIVHYRLRTGNLAHKKLRIFSLRCSSQWVRAQLWIQMGQGLHLIQPLTSYVTWGSNLAPNCSKSVYSCLSLKAVVRRGGSGILAQCLAHSQHLISVNLYMCLQAFLFFLQILL